MDPRLVRELLERVQGSDVSVEEALETLRQLPFRDIGVATVPGSSFFQDKALGRPYVRFCFCKRDETLDEAAQRLRKLRVIV